MTVTIDQLRVTASGHLTDGVISHLSALYYAQRTGTIITLSHVSKGTWFYTDNHLFGYKVLSNDFVPCTSVFPMKVSPREGVESGLINTAQQYELVFHKDDYQLTNTQQLVDYCNAVNPCITDCEEAVLYGETANGKRIHFVCDLITKGENTSVVKYGDQSWVVMTKTIREI